MQLASHHLILVSKHLIANAAVMCGVFLWLPNAAIADAPILLAIEPPCAQIGTTQEIVLRGFRFDDAEEIICHEPGVAIPISGSAEEWPADREKRQLRATIDVSPDVPPGNIHLRVRTRSGLSNPRSLHVNRLPILAEVNTPHNRDQAQPIPLESTLWGHLAQNETDWYSLKLTKGERVSLELLGQRISPTYIDATIRIYSPDDKLLREADTSPLYYHDPATSFVATQDGVHLISIHDTRNGVDQNDSRYGMGSDCLYVLHVGDFPQPTSLFPLGGVCGENVDFELTGDPLGIFRQRAQLSRQTTFRLGTIGALHGVWPFRMPETIYPTRGDQAGKRVVGTGPLFFMASQHKSILEVADHQTAATAQHLPFGEIAVEGRISKVGETDWYRVQGVPDREYVIEVYARRLRSPLDSKLVAFPAGLNGLPVENDDRGSYDLDSKLKIRMRPEGCLVALSDSREFGDDTFGYRLVIGEPRPQTVLTTAPLETLTLLPLFKTGQQIPVPRGGRMLLLLRTIVEEGESPRLNTKLTGLPTGMRAEVAVVSNPATYYPVVLSADPEAPLAAALATPSGVREDGELVEFHQEIGLIHGHPAQTAWHLKVFDKVAVATVESLPFAVELKCESPRAVAGTKTNLLIKVHRDAGWAKPLTIMFPCLPPNATLGMVEVPADRSEVSVPFEVPANSPPGRWPIVAVVTDSDLPHLRQHHWPYYSKANAAGETHGLNWVSSGIDYLEVESSK